MASILDQRSNNQYSLPKNAEKYDFEDELEMEHSANDNESSSNSETDTEEEFIPEMITKWDVACKRLACTTQINLKRKSKIERRPTRRPDPNTCNRNALMARENRKRKKEYVEKLENSISQYLKTQKKLRKIVKKQARFIQKLQNEKRYYKNILSNKSKILSLVTSIKQNSHSASTTNLLDNNETPQTSPTYSTSECFRSDSFSSQTDFNDLFDINGTVIEQDVNLFSAFSDFNYFSTDYNTNTLHDSWDNLLECENPIFSVKIDDDKVIQNQFNMQNINNEHNYVNTNINSNEVDEDDDVGVCLHINKGKISLEFCPKCNLKSTTKLLSDTELDVIT